MRFIVIGLGVQGKKRLTFCHNCVATVDPFKEEATFKNIREVPLNSFDAAIVSTPEDQKLFLLEYLLQNKKHVLVEKPLLSEDNEVLKRLKSLAESQNVACYTAYNHCFEPHVVKVKNHLRELGEIYTCRLFYGNGTARDVRNSVWRDKGLGVLTDLGSHLLNLLLFWFDELPEFEMIKGNCFENKSYDHALMNSKKFQLEMSLLCWKNHFACDLFGENGSLHIDSLCKWGPSTFTYRKRKLPSGKPEEEILTLVQSDPTWKKEYEYFLQMCKNPANTLGNDILINNVFKNLECTLLC